MTFEPSRSNPSVVAKLRNLSLASGVVVALVGLIVLIGWALGNDTLRGAFAEGITVKTNAAVGLVLLGIALVLFSPAAPPRWRVWLARVLAGTAFLIGFLTLIENRAGLDLGIDQLLFREVTGAAATVSPNRMGMPASICLVLLGAALALLGWRTRRGVVVSQWLALAAILLMLFPMLGYLYSIPVLYDVASVTGIALTTALAFLLLACGILCARPEIGFIRRVVADDGGGIVVRRLLPAALLLPIVLGSLRQAGQDAGLYDANFGRILGLVSFIVVFSGLTLWTGKVISLHARARARAEAAESELQKQLLATLESERTARAAAERSSRMKDEFLANLSHELRTPLQAIVGWTHVLSHDGLAPEDLRRGVETIGRNARLQTQLIEDLLDMSRIVSGKIQLEVEDVDVARVIDAVLDAVRPAAQSKNLMIESRVVPRPAIVRGESARLQQILWNLMSNAIKFTPAGGRIELRLSREGTHYNLRVRDSGVGIRSELLGEIFERFSQADSSTKREFGGLGLGLSIARQLTELHGGVLMANSDGEGTGATFTLRLPVAAVLGEPAADGAGDSEETDPRLVTVDLSGLRVLVVDDQEDARELIARILRARQAEVWTSQDVTSALSLLGTVSFHVLVSDIGMPARDGYDLIREVRAKGIGLPAIALTAFARPEERTRVLAAGYQAHLAKPVDPAHLALAVARVKEPEVQGLKAP
jgi:signal transduction histidine kinase/CheY-like chemotaxis protein